MQDVLWFSTRFHFDGTGEKNDTKAIDIVQIADHIVATYRPPMI